MPKDKDDPLSQIQKSFQETNVKRLEVEVTSLKEENSRLVNDNRSLNAKLEALEIRNKHLALAANKKVSDFDSMMLFSFKFGGPEISNVRFQCRSFLQYKLPCWVSSCSNIGSTRDDPYWISRKNSLELIELSNINKVSLV